MSICTLIGLLKIKHLSKLVSLAFEDEGAVPMRTTPFPDIIRITPAPGPYPSFTPRPEGEEIVSGEIDILSPLPIPPSVTDTYTKMTHVVREPGLHLTGAEMAPTGGLVLYLIYFESYYMFHP